MPTLTPTEVLQQTLSAFRTLFPFIGRMGVDFSTAAPLRLEQTVIAHIRSLPTVANYDATTGYANGAVSARTLLTDLPILVDSHKHVPVYLDHLDAIKDLKETFLGVTGDMAYQLGKSMVDSILDKCTGANLSYSQTATTANSDLDVIEQITTDMNGNGAAPRGRVGLVNSAVAQTLALDSRIGSKDYYGQLTGGGGLRMFKGIGGFEAIYEYPALDANNAAGQAFTAASTDICTATAHGYETGDRVRVTTTAADLPAGLAVDTTYYVIKLTADTFKLASSDANATAGTAVDISDAGTGTHTITGYENVSGLFFEAQAIALRAGVPAQSHEIARAMGIPETAKIKNLADPITGFPLAHVCWMNPGTLDLYQTITSLWGSAVGRQAGAAAALTDKAAVLLRTA